MLFSLLGVYKEELLLSLDNRFQLIPDIIVNIYLCAENRIIKNDCFEILCVCYLYM
jgi:hypothetical protein